MFLTNLMGDSIQWKYPWMEELAFARTRHLYFIEVIGLGGIQPYTPLRVLRQFGVVQDIPLWSSMALHEDGYGALVIVARVRNQQAESGII